MRRPGVLAISTAALVTSAWAQSPAKRPSVPGAPAGAIAFVDVSVIPMDTEQVLAGQTVVVEQGRVLALGPSAQVQVPAGAMRIDGRGKFLLPGLVDMHAHLSTSDSIEARRRLARWLGQGVTTVRNMDYENRHRESSLLSLRLRAQAAAGMLASPRIYTSGVWGPANYIRSIPGKPAPQLDSIPAYVAAYQAAGYDFIKPHDERGDVFVALVAAAARLKLPVAGHVDSVPLERALAGGIGSIEHLTGYGFQRSDSASRQPSSHIPALASATRRAGVWNCPTLLLYVPAQPLAGASITELQHRHRLVKTLQDSGAGLLLGTDAGVHDIHFMASVDLELQELVAAGLTPYQALVTGTRNPAIYFGTLDESGTIAVGKRADFVLVRDNPLADIRHVTQPAGVMIGGRWLTRAALSQRLADALPNRGSYYREYYRAALRDHFLLPLTRHLLLADSTGQLLIDRTQHTLFGSLRSTQEEDVASLLEALVSGPPATGTPTGPNHQRLLQLAGRHLGEIRSIVRPEQQAVFDTVARAWLQQYAGQGYRIAIPGVAP